MARRIVKNRNIVSSNEQPRSSRPSSNQHEPIQPSQETHETFLEPQTSNAQGISRRIGQYRTRASRNGQPWSSIPSPNQPEPNQPSPNNETEETQETFSESQMSDVQGARKKTGRGKAKGEKGQGMPVEFYDNRIITTEVSRNIGVLFKQEITEPCINFTDYAKTRELGRLFDRFKGSGFTYTCSKEELKHAFESHVKRNYSDWMWRLRASVFNKYKSTGQRYANRPSNVPDPEVWNKMVDAWLDPNWQEEMENKKTATVEENLQVSDWEIYG